MDKKLELPKTAIQHITLYAHGLVSLTELAQSLHGMGIVIVNIDSTFVAGALSLSGGEYNSGQTYMHLSRPSGETDGQGFAINDEVCSVSL